VPPPGLAEPLTGRELEVLRLLAAGRSNQRIAHDLVVALDTVKKHVTHILGKLGAAGRTEAAAGPPAGPDPLTPHPGPPR
jgi:LuxR family transcriptional regulator, maltose regulon positive regulatory protein